MSVPGPAPSPEPFFDTITAYQRTAGLKGALDLALFSAIGGGRETGGEAYTLAEYERMVRAAGFLRSELQPLPPTAQHVIISYR
jgi:hypothetical protein